MVDFVRFARRVSGHYTPHLQPYWDVQDQAGVASWLASGRLPGKRGELLPRLREQFPECAEIVLADSGKTALYAVLQILQLGKDSEVIVPSYCCASVVAAIIRAGAIPVLADSDENLNIAYDSVLSALSPRTAAILVPHLFGLKADALEAIIALGREKGIPVIEDVTQAYGLRFADGRLAGSQGDAAIFSAGLGKPIMGPGGGWGLVNRPCNKPSLLPEEPLPQIKARVRNFMRRFTGPRSRRGRAEIAHAIRSRLLSRFGAQPALGLQRWAATECRGYGMSDVEAWLTAGQVGRIEENIRLRRANARRWMTLLAEHAIPCRTLPEAMNTFTAFPLLFTGDQGRGYAARFRTALEANGVSTQPCYTPLHLRPHGAALRRTDMSRVESMWQGVFTVPVRPNLDEADWAHMSRAVRLSARACA